MTTHHHQCPWDKACPGYCAPEATQPRQATPYALFRHELGDRRAEYAAAERHYWTTHATLLGDPQWTTALVATWPHVPKIHRSDSRPPVPPPARIRWTTAAVIGLYHDRPPTDPATTLNRLLGLPPPPPACGHGAPWLVPGGCMVCGPSTHTPDTT